MSSNGPDRREHLEEPQFLSKLQKMFTGSKTDGNGPVSISFGRMKKKWADKIISSKKGKSGPLAVVRATRKKKTISIVLSAGEVVRFQSKLAECLNKNIDTLRRPEKKVKKLKKAKKSATTTDESPKK